MTATDQSTLQIMAEGFLLAAVSRRAEPSRAQESMTRALLALLAFAQRSLRELRAAHELRCAQAHLSQLDEHLLRDIGVGRNEIGRCVRQGRRLAQED